MKIGFYSKIAVDNIKKNPRLYVPRILAEAGLLGCFYIMITLALDEKLANVRGGDYISIFMCMGAVIIGFLSFILILYINSFLMKQRKNEYGLYNVLGMEKRHIIKVLFSESIITSIISTVLGTGVGMLLYKLSLLVICKLLKIDAITGFYYINVKTIVLPIIIFAGLDLFAFIVNSVSVRRLKPVELLLGKNIGEKEPKVKWLLLIIGILSLGSGYAIALIVKNPLQAIYLFFLAVILVIIGTYCLFITGTTFVLRCLKKNKKYYYNKNRMPAISGLLFRMKQNAVGLASIAILATGVLVMISTTVSLYSGMEDALDNSYPQQLYLSALYVPDEKIVSIPLDDLTDAVTEVANKNNVEIKDIECEQYLSASYIFREGELLTKTEVTNGWELDEIVEVTFITESDYTDLMNKKMISGNKNGFQLEKNEIVYFSQDGLTKGLSSIIMNGKEYNIKDTLNYFPIQSNNGELVKCIGIVISDADVLDEIYLAQKEAYGDYASEYTDRIAVTFTDEKAVSVVGKEMVEDIKEKLRSKYSIYGAISYNIDTKWETRENVIGVYGTFLFLGILLGFVCLFSTILIIYYKQISEGYEDRNRFQIMQKIGMEKREVKKTIQSQLTLQFFLPLVTAGIHTAFAFPILLKLLKILMLSNTTLFIICTAITFSIFAIVYIIVYLLTSRTYYKIVN